MMGRCPTVASVYGNEEHALPVAHTSARVVEEEDDEEVARKLARARNKKRPPRLHVTEANNEKAEPATEHL
jgi:hypothetical protein